MLRADDTMIAEAAEAVEGTAEILSVNTGDDKMPVKEEMIEKDGQMLGLGGVGIRFSSEHGAVA